MILNHFFKFFNKISPIIIQTPCVGAIGNCAEEIHYGLLRARDENKKVLFLFPKELWGPFKFSKCGLGINQELLKVESRYRFLGYSNPISQFFCWLLTFIYCGFKVLDYFLSKFKIYLDKDYLIPNIGQRELWDNGENDFKTAIEKYKWPEQLSDYLEVDLPKKSREKTAVFIKEMGLPEDAWFVCLHVRASGYYGKNDSGIIKTIRNCDISNYFEAIKFINDQGGWVIRMGDSTMKKLPKMDKVIDYPHTDFKSDLMDICLIKDCRYYMGSDSGLWDVAALFQKPMICPNLTYNPRAYPYRKGDLGIYKAIYSKSNERNLSIQEIYKYSLGQSKDLLDMSLFEHRENKPNEILELVEEFFRIQKSNGEMSELQKKCNNLRSLDRFISDQGEKNIILLDEFKLASSLVGYQGTLGQKYLENNWE